MTNTRKMAFVAILSTLSFLLMFVQMPLIPSASFLQVDLSILPILLGLVLLDIRSSLSILLLRSLLKLLLNNQGVGTYIGLPMNMVMIAVFVLAFGLFWKKSPGTKNFILAGLVGTLASTLVMLVLNYIYAMPLYAAFANFDIGKIIGVVPYLFSMVLPFNLIQGVIYTVAFALTFSALTPVLKSYEI